MTPKERGKKGDELNHKLKVATGIDIEWKFLRHIDMRKLLKLISEYYNSGGCK